MRRAIDRSLARHSPDNTAPLILTNIMATGLPHREHSQSTILAHSGQHYADPCPANILRSRMKKHIDRRAMPIYSSRPGKLTLETARHPLDEQMRMSGRNIHAPRPCTLAIFGFLDRELT